MSWSSIFFQSDPAQLPLVGATFYNGSSLGTAALNLAPPPNAYGVYVYAETNNTANLRLAFGGAIGSSFGVAFEAGRSEFFPFGSTLSIKAESGTQAFTALWLTS